MVFNLSSVTTDLRRRTSFVSAAEEWRTLTPADMLRNAFVDQDDRQTRKNETGRVRALRSRGFDTVLVLQQAARDFEDKLNIADRWSSSHPAFIKAAQSADEIALDRAIDVLEGLVIARLFELAKMNKAGLGVFSFLCVQRTFYLQEPFRIQDTNCVARSPLPSRVAPEPLARPSTVTMNSHPVFLGQSDQG